MAVGREAEIGFGKLAQLQDQMKLPLQVLRGLRIVNELGDGFLAMKDLRLPMHCLGIETPGTASAEQDRHRNEQHRPQQTSPLDEQVRARMPPLSPSFSPDRSHQMGREVEGSG